MPDRLRLSFGIYRGYYIDEAPLDYLSWVLANIRPRPDIDSAWVRSRDQRTIKT